MSLEGPGWPNSALNRAGRTAQGQGVAVRENPLVSWGPGEDALFPQVGNAGESSRGLNFMSSEVLG